MTPDGGRDGDVEEEAQSASAPIGAWDRATGPFKARLGEEDRDREKARRCQEAVNGQVAVACSDGLWPKETHDEHRDRKATTKRPAFAQAEGAPGTSRAQAIRSAAKAAVVIVRLPRLRRSDRARELGISWRALRERAACELRRRWRTLRRLGLIQGSSDREGNRAEYGQNTNRS
jgi:hypothetical protein